MPRGSAIVVDIGKTVSKVTLWSDDGRMLDRQARPNETCVTDGLRRLDVHGIGTWLIEALAKHREKPVETIVPVGHGAGVVALVDDQLAFAPLDYEQAVPEDVTAAYANERDPFSLTGSPLLPDGLNFGAQLFWLERLHPRAMSRARLLPWAQYWAWFLSGEACTEVTSLGCHSDVWAPDLARYSPMAERFGWSERFAPMARAQDSIGTLRPSIAEATGLSPRTQILAGLHDSNAALLAAGGFTEFAHQEMTTLSTGTWFVAMRRPICSFRASDLAEGRDCLINVDPYGWRVPSARFMGGREIEAIIEFDTRRVDIKPDQPALMAAAPQVMADRTMLLPTLAPGCGPFPDRAARWIDEPPTGYARRAAACLYAALVADASLDLIGSEEQLLVEGRFAQAEVFVGALAALRPHTQVFTANAHNDVSFGALRLLDPSLVPHGDLAPTAPLAADVAGYRETWRAALEVLA